MKTFSQVRKYLSSIPSINSGGCVFAALFMKLWLEKNKNISVPIIYTYMDNEDFERNDIVLNKISRVNPTSCKHALIKYNKAYIDCNSSRLRLRDLHHAIDNISFIEKSVNQVEKWNDEFDRKLIKKMERDLSVKIPFKVKRRSIFTFLKNVIIIE